MSNKTLLFIMFLFTLSFVFASCGSKETTPITEEVTSDTELATTGQLSFAANGEDFVRKGFVSSDGWEITFHHVYLTITDVTAYQTDPPYDPHSNEEITSDSKVKLNTTVTVDLAEGENNAAPISVGVIENVSTGHYNALSWKLVPAGSGLSEGYSILIEAQASKGDQSYNVTLGFEDSYRYYAGEFVGDTRKGFVTEETPGDLEMTFHFDHIFGDFTQPSDSDLNVMAIGFEPFAGLMQEGTVYEDLASLSQALPEETYEKLLEVLPTLGHTGEGHCFCTVIHE